MSSRLIIKGLPTTIDEAKLKKLFSDRGTVTDCQLKFTPEGKFRKFAFIGFHNDKDATDALQYFDQTFIGSSRVTVEICRPFGDELKPRAWSKYAKDSSAFQKLNQFADKNNDKPVKPIKKPANVDVISDKSSIVQDQVTSMDKEVTHCEISKKVKKKKSKKKLKEDVLWNAADIDYPLIQQCASLLQSWASEKGITDACLVRKLPISIKSRQMRDLIAPIKAKHIRLLRDEANTCAVALIACNRISELNACVKKNGNFVGGNKIEVVKFLVGSVPLLPEDQSFQLPQTAQTAEWSALEGKDAAEAIFDTGRLFVRNLSFLTSEQDLNKLFTKFGPVADVNIISDNQGHSKGYALVTMMMPEQAVQAYTTLDGSIFQGRMLHIIPGKDKPGDEKTKDIESGELSFKDKKATNLKMLAAKGSTWNTLFLGANSVADVIAASLDTEKADLLDSHAAGSTSKKKSKKNKKEDPLSLGVRMALSETQLVRDTREFLMSQGVDVNVFGMKKGKLSKSVILVKNLPAATKKEDVEKRFGDYGRLGRVVLPPSGVTCIVEFMNENDAAKAFKAQAFARFGSLPLFLEWAPDNVFSAPIIEQKKNVIEQKSQEIESELTMEQALESVAGEKLEDLDEPEPETSIFVKNLNFVTTDEDLKLKFSRIGKVVSASVAKKKHPKEPGTMLSMGYGFVQYMRQEGAQRAIKELQGSHLDGHSLQLKLSTSNVVQSRDNTDTNDTVDAEQGTCSKILVRNIPFQANSSEIQDLFSAFGTVINVRMPSKVVTSSGTKSHRGFGFVEFCTKASAKQAFDSLRYSTHLYGRRLVLEWAKTDETIEDVRKRTAHHFETGEEKAVIGKSRRLMKEALERGNHGDDDQE